jgi:carboxymethylenebutenolidase
MTTNAAAIHTGETHFAFEGASIRVYVARPAAAPRVTVLMLGAIWSVTPHIEELCRSLAQAGYGAIAPCLFRGTGIPVRDAPPEALAQVFLDFDDCRCIRDLRAVARAAIDGRFGFPPGAVVPWGFCLGGRFAHYLGAVSEHVAGVINFYGRLRFARQPSKPFLPAEVTPLIDVPYLGQFAETDALIPLADVDELRAALEARGVPHRIDVYGGARHSFFDPTRPADHHPEAAAKAWATSLAFLQDLSMSAAR